MKFLSKKVFSLGTIIFIHVTFSIALIMSWTIIKRGFDFSVASFGDESFYIAGGPGRFNIAAIVIGALFKHLYFNHLTFYLLNTLLSTATVIVFFYLARSCLSRKIALYITAIFAFNPELVFYNNFVVKENMLILLIIVAMYFFFKALSTNLLGYKIIFCLFLPVIALIREPFALMGLLPLVFLKKSTRRLVVISAFMAAFGLMFPIYEKFYYAHIGNYGATIAIFEDIYGLRTSVTFGELFNSPGLLAEYLFRSFLFYVRPGWSAGLKFNTFLVPYTLFVVFVFATSFRYRKYLTSTHRTAYSFIAFTIILISLALIIYNPVERYRYSVYQLGFSLLVLNLSGYHEYIYRNPVEVKISRAIRAECA